MGREIEIPGASEPTSSQCEPGASATSAPQQGAREAPSLPTLPAQELRYLTLIEQLPAILYISDYGEDGRCYFVSPKIRELLGFAPIDWLENTKFWITRMHPDDRNRALAEEEEARRTGKNLRCEYRLQHQNGRYLWFRDEAVPLPRPDGPPLLHGVLYDIHESKLTENALRQAEARYREVIEKLPAAAYIADFNPDAPWKYVSPQIETLLGVPQREWLRQPGMWLAHVHPDDRELARAATAQIRVQSGPFHMEYRMVARDGRVVWVQDAGTVAHDTGGKPELIHSILTNITERKKKEQELSASEQRLRLALEASGMGTFDMDARTGCVSWDSRGGRLFQLPEHLKGRPFRDLLFRVHPEDRGLIVRQVEYALATGKAIHMEFRITLDDGSEEWRFVHGKAIRDASGEIVRISGIGEGISERKRAEEALRRSEEQLSLALESSGLSLWDLNLSTSDAFLDESWSAMLGGPPGPTRTNLQELFSITHPEDRDRIVREGMRTVRGEAERYSVEHRVRDAQGHWIWIRSTGKVIERGADGRALRAIGTNENITGRKQIEEKLRESQDRLQHTLNNAPLVVFSLDPHGTLLLSEGHGLEALGLKPGQVVGQSIYELHKDDPGIIANFHRAISGEEFISLDQVTRPRDLTFETSWIPLRHTDGTIAGAAGVATNVTERELAQKALRESEMRLRLTLQAAGMGVWEWDAATDRTTWDLSLRQILGISPGEFDGRAESFVAWVHPQDRQKFVGAKQRATQTHEMYQLDFRVFRPDGRMLWISDQGWPEFDASGRLVRYRGVARDVTQRRELQEQLQRAQKMEAIGQLAGGVAHDFNNLLTLIRGNTEALLEHVAQNPAYQNNAEAVLKAADRAAGITRQLLAFSSQQVMQPKVLELGGVVSETASLLRRLLGPTIKLELQLAADSLYVRADATQLEQVVLNLVINARDAMPDGGTVTVSIEATAKGSVAVRRYPQMRDEDYARLCVKDTGIGMDAATQARIFEPFFTTKALGKGTGLGLATVYGIVKQSEGWIWADSTLGQGTCFEVFLPEVAAPEPDEQPPAARTMGLRGTETLVLVDDEQDIRLLLAEFLAGLGYQVIEAASGEEALEKAGRHDGEVHLLITDALMPGMQGLELAQRLRTIRPIGGVLYISGYAEDTGILSRLPRDGEEFLQKPFGLTELATKIRGLLRG